MQMHCGTKCLVQWKGGPYIRGPMLIVKGSSIFKNYTNAFFVLSKAYKTHMRYRTPRQWRLLFRERDVEVTQVRQSQALLRVCSFPPFWFFVLLGNTNSALGPRRLEFSWPRSGTALADAVLVPTNGQIRFKLVGYPDHISHRNLSIRITNTSPAPDEPLNGADVTHLFQRSWSEHQEPKGKHTLCTLQPTSATSRVGYFLSGSQRLLKKTSHIVRFFLSTDETQGVTWNRRMKIMAKDNKRIEKHDQEFLVGKDSILSNFGLLTFMQSGRSCKMDN